MKVITTLALCLSLLAPTGGPAAAPAGPGGAPPASPALGPGQEEIPEWQARWELARLLSYEKRYEESLKEYRLVLAQKPDLQEAKLEMAKVLSWAGRGAEALPILKSAPLEALDDPARLTLADLLISQKQYRPAEEILVGHLSRHPDDQAARLKLAELLSWDKRYDASLAEFRRILADRPDDIQVRRKYAFVLIWDGQREQAAAELRKTLPETQAPAKR